MARKVYTARDWKMMLVGLVIMVGIGYAWVKSPSADPPQATPIVQADQPQAPSISPEQQVVNDSLRQLRLVLKSGTMTDLCVQAGMVKAAMLQADDQAGYAEWNVNASYACNVADIDGDGQALNVLQNSSFAPTRARFASYWPK